jgi:hypothetical protein
VPSSDTAFALSCAAPEASAVDVAGGLVAVVEAGLATVVKGEAATVVEGELFVLLAPPHPAKESDAVAITTAANVLIRACVGFLICAPSLDPAGG